LKINENPAIKSVQAILPCPRTCGATQGNIAYTPTVMGKAVIFASDNQEKTIKK